MLVASLTLVVTWTGWRVRDALGEVRQQMISQLVTEDGGGAQVLGLGQAVSAFEGGSAVLEAGLLPGLERRRLVTKVSDRHLFNQVAPELLPSGRRVIFAGAFATGLFAFGAWDSLPLLLPDISRRWADCQVGDAGA